MRRTLFLAYGLALISAGCAVGPDYKRPSTPSVSAYKEAPEGWANAAPNDAAIKGDWWNVFNDPVLDSLEHRVSISNQNVAAYAAAYDEARAVVREQRSQMFPTVDLDAGATRSRQASNGGVATGSSAGGTTTFTSGNSASDVYQVNIGATWELDLWGKLRRQVESARASAAASAGDLGNAQLSAQGEVASDYWQLRETDQELDLVGKTVEAYQRSLDITQNRYDAHIAAKSDVLQAQSQLYTARATLEGLKEQRAQLEHAIAVLVGEAPESFSIDKAVWDITVPDVPVTVPAQLLERRPDIAAAERRVAAANATIGVDKAGYFPSLSLSASGGTTGTELNKLFSAGSYFWSLGASVAQTVFDAGATRATVAAARASYNQSVANYRETVLTALQNVEDELVALQVLARQYDLRKQASAAADETEERSLNQYRSGLISYTDVVTVQATALTDRVSLAQTARDRQTTTVALIQALGGGWNAKPAAQSGR